MAKKITQIEINGETYDINGGGGGSAGNALKQVPNMATYTPTDGEIVQYIGATTTDYVHGGLYEYGSNMTTFNIGANKAGISQGTYRTKAAPTSTNIFASNYTGSDGNNYQGASQYNKLQVGDVAWNSSTYEPFLITDVQNNGETLTLENGVTATYTNSTSGGLAQMYEIDGYYFLISDSNSIVSRAGVTSRSGFIILSDVGSAFNNYSTAVVSGWFQIAEIGAGNVTVKKQGSTVKTFNVNQQWNTIIDLPDDVRMAHFNSGKAFIVEVTACVQINGEFFDSQELIDNPDDPRPFIPIDGEYYYATNINRVYSYDDYEGVVDVTDTVLISGNTNVLYVDVDTNQSFRYNGTTFVKITDSSKADDVPTFTEAATRANLAGSGESTLTLWGKIKKWFSDLKSVAFSGSYNDLSNKPLSVENSKVKYTLSDGITKLTLAQESDLKTVSFTGKSIDCYDLKITIPSYKCCLIADIDNFYRSPSSTTSLPFQGFVGRLLKSRGGGNIAEASAEVSCCVSYQNTDTEYHFTISSTHFDICPCIVLYNNKYYLCIDENVKKTDNVIFLYGYLKNCLNTPLIVNSADCTVVRGWIYSIRNATTSSNGLMSAEDKLKVNTIGIIYRGALQHNLQVMQSGSNLIHIHCQDFESDSCCLDCYVAARGTIGSAYTFTWHYAFSIFDKTKWDIETNYNGVINVINKTGRPDTDFILFVDKLI